MKKFFLLAVLIMSVCAVIFAQVTPAPPTGWGDVIINFKDWFVSLTSVSVLIAFVAAFVNGIFKVENAFLRQVVAWLVGIVAVVGSDLLNFGFAADLPIMVAVIQGIISGFTSNGAYDIPWIKVVLNAIENWFNTKKATTK